MQHTRVKAPSGNKMQKNVWPKIKKNEFAYLAPPLRYAEPDGLPMDRRGCRLVQKNKAIHQGWFELNCELNWIRLNSELVRVEL